MYLKKIYSGGSGDPIFFKYRYTHYSSLLRLKFKILYFCDYCLNKNIKLFLIQLSTAKNVQGV